MRRVSISDLDSQCAVCAKFLKMRSPFMPFRRYWRVNGWRVCKGCY